MDKKISQLNEATVLTDADVLPVVNSAETKKVTVSTLKTNIRTGLALTSYVDSQDALKVDKIAGKGLSTEDYTSAEKSKLSGIEAGANLTTQTSQLTNNGADGINPFITALDIPTTGQASTLVREVKNMTGATLTKGTVVYISGANGNKALVSKALATTDALSSRTFGLLQSNISNNGLGNCVIIGDLSGLDTSAFTEGDQLYLSGVTAGTYTNTKILAPTHLVYVGKITRSHPTLGQIEVGIQNGYELSEIHDVALSSVADKQLLSYDNATSLWKNKSVTTDDISDSVNKRYQTDNQQSFNDATSSIQTQLNGKQSTLTYVPYRYINTTQSSVTGLTTETIMATTTISANTFSSNDIMKILFEVSKTATIVGPSLRIKINTTNSLSGATTIALYNMPLANTYALMQRNLFLSSGNLNGFSFSTTAISDITTATNAASSITYNPANVLYLFFTIQLGNVADTVNFTMGNITN